MIDRRIYRGWGLQSTGARATGNRNRPVASLLLATQLIPITVSANAPLQRWIDSFYHSRSLCGNSTVAGTVLTDQQLRVDLIIDPGWARSMEAYDQQASDRWFAIHCPLPFESAAALLDGRDIIIATQSIGATEYTMSCRDFSATLGAEAAGRQLAARSRVQKILDKLGLSN